MGYRHILSLGILFLASVLVSPLSTAQQNASESDVNTLPADIRLIIDVSGSMKRNDPSNLRQPAVELLVQLLPEGSKSGIWTFGKWVNMLVPHAAVSSPWREGAAKKSGQINSVGLYTNIGGALEKAAFNLSKPDSRYRTSIILLTDGMVDIDKDPEVNRSEWRRIVDEILPRLKELGYTIHTIALSSNADRDLLNKLSLGTGGITEVAYSAEDLMRIFLKAFDVASPAEQVPLEKNSFVIDSSVEEFTALIFRKDPSEQTELIGPDDTVYANSGSFKEMKWHRAKDYDLITVKRPLEGEWLLDVDMNPESRITIVSNLNLRVKPLSNNIFQGAQEKLSLLLQEDGVTITRPEFLSLMTINAEMEAGNDEHSLKRFWQEEVTSDKVPENGIFKKDLPTFEKNGVYKLKVLVDGKTFTRKFTHQFTVREPFEAEVTQEFIDEKTEYVLKVYSYLDNIVVNKTQVEATITDPRGEEKVYSPAATGLDSWKEILQPEREGEYRVGVNIRGVDKRGKTISVTLNEIRFNYSVDKGFVEEAEPFFEEQQKPDPAEETEKQPEKKEKKFANKKKVVQKEVVKESIPDWVLYLALGLGNLILFVAGVFIYKKIMKGDQSDEILEQFSDERIEETVEAEESEEEQSTEEDNGAEEDEDLEEEPPMEDLDPVSEESVPEESGTEDNLNEVADPVDLAENLAEEPPAEEPVDSTEGLDDLDTMEMPDASADVDEELLKTQEDDDMVDEMLKAQGLDLAGDELDSAISDLIDNLEDDEEA